jgi:hypothetical protein
MHICLSGCSFWVLHGESNSGYAYGAGGISSCITISRSVSAGSISWDMCSAAACEGPAMAPLHACVFDPLVAGSEAHR